MRLPDVPLQSIEVSLGESRGLVPGSSARLSVVARTLDGRTFAMAGTAGGKVLPGSFRFESSVVTVDRSGVVTLPEDPRLSEGRIPHVRVTAVGQASPVGELDIPVRYDAAFSGTYSGHSGMQGRNGFDGYPGQDGTPGSFDPNNPVAGGNGGNGSDGENGATGDDGGPGPDVHVWIAVEDAPRPLLRVRISERGQDHFFLIDPNGGSLSIAVRGGAGGPGGFGGHGGSAGQGGAGLPPGVPGLPGHDGRDGQSGWGGAAGRIRVEIDPSASRYLQLFGFKNTDGDGRLGPPPDIVTRPVTVQW
jgi:hypothetical protein